MLRPACAALLLALAPMVAAGEEMAGVAARGRAGAADGAVLAGAGEVAAGAGEMAGILAPASTVRSPTRGGSPPAPETARAMALPERGANAAPDEAEVAAARRGRHLPERAAQPGTGALDADLRAHGAIAAAAAAAWLAAEAARDRIAPDSCRTCGTTRLDAWARDRLAWGSPRGALRASDALAFVALPAAAVAHGVLAARAAGDARAAALDLVAVAEATALALDANTLLRLAVARERPIGEVEGDNVSFPSGHTALAFALVASAGTVAQLRGYRTARWVWGVGLAAAAAAGYLRVAGGAHHLTDVAAGAALGTAVGVAVPRLVHGTRSRRLAVVPVGLVGVAAVF